MKVDPIRSKIMRAVPRKDSVPEIRVRKVLHRLGLRFRLHRVDLPGTPDVVLPRHRAAIFVHGCFWHRHPNCAKATTPKQRAEFWHAKFGSNIARDARNVDLLEKAGWRVLTVWECEAADTGRLERIFRKYFKIYDGRDFRTAVKNTRRKSLRTP